MNIRAFIAIPLEPRLRDELIKLQIQLEADLKAGLVRWTRPEQLHLTLKFLGHVASDRLADLKAATARAGQGLSAFTLTIESVGCFPSVQRPNVIWVGIAGDLDPLRQVHKQVDLETQEFGSHSEDRDFHPHLTIGRVKAPGRETRRLGDLLRNAPVLKLSPWPVNEIELVQSQLSPQGSRYTKLETVILPK